MDNVYEIAADGPKDPNTYPNQPDNPHPSDPDHDLPEGPEPDPYPVKIRYRVQIRT
jgi:hypothetical protein